MGTPPLIYCPLPDVASRAWKTNWSLLLDRNIGKAILIGVPLLVFVFYTITVNKYPKAIPLQASLDQILPLSAQVNAGVVDVETLRAEYRDTGKIDESELKDQEWQR